MAGQGSRIGPAATLGSVNAPAHPSRAREGSVRRPRRLAVLTLTIGLLLGSCRGADETPSADRGLPAEVAADLGARPDASLHIPPDTAPPVDLVVADLVVGEGAPAAPGSVVQVHYVGATWTEHAEFDASWDRGEPFTFEIGTGRVIAGWEEGVRGMKVGGRRVLTIPPELAYGDRGANAARASIAPGETLVFVVDLLAAEPAVAG